jgi:hypothetical protein
MEQPAGLIVSRLLIGLILVLALCAWVIVSLTHSL